LVENPSRPLPFNRRSHRMGPRKRVNGKRPFINSSIPSPRSASERWLKVQNSEPRQRTSSKTRSYHRLRPDGRRPSPGSNKRRTLRWKPRRMWLMWRGKMIHERTQRSSYLRRPNDYAIERSANPERFGAHQASRLTRAVHGQRNGVHSMTAPATYTPPKVWKWEGQDGGKGITRGQAPVAALLARDA